MRTGLRMLFSLLTLAALTAAAPRARCDGGAASGVDAAAEFISSGRFSAAVDALEAELRTDPRSARANALMGLLCAEVADQDRAPYYQGRAAVLGGDDPSVLALLAMARFASGDPLGAASFAESALGRGVEDAGCTTIRGLAMMREHPREGYALVEEGHRLDPSDPWVLVIYLMAAGMERGAETQQRLVQVAASDAGATYLTHLMCAEAYGTLVGDAPAASAEFRAAMKTVPDDAMAIRYVGRTLVRAGHSGDARQLFARKRDVLGADVPEQYWLGRALIEGGQYETAARELEVATLMWDDDASSRVAFGEALLLEGDADKARWQFDIATRADTTNGRAHWLLASAFLVAEEFEDARLSGLAATRHDSMLYKPWIVVGMSSKELGDMAEAARCYKKAAELAPLDYGLQREAMALLADADDWQTVFELGEWIVGDGPWQRDDDALVLGMMVEAADELDRDEDVRRLGDRLLAASDAPFVALMTVAERYDETDDATFVEPYLRAAEKRMEDSADAHESVARSAGYVGLYDMALGHALRAVELDSTMVNAYLIASSVSNATEAPEDGERFARRALELEPDSDPGAFDLGRSLVMQGDYEEAVEVLVPLVARDPSRIGAGADLATAWAALGDFDRSMETATTAAELAPDSLRGYPFSKVALYFAAERDSSGLIDVYEVWSQYRLSHGIQDSVNELGAWKREIRNYDW